MRVREFWPLLKRAKVKKTPCMHKPVLLSSTVDIACGSFRVEGLNVEGQGFLTGLQLSEGQQDALHALAYVAARRTWRIVWENVFTSTLLSSIQRASGVRVVFKVHGWGSKLFLSIHLKVRKQPCMHKPVLVISRPEGALLASSCT